MDTETDTYRRTWERQGFIAFMFLAILVLLLFVDNSIHSFIRSLKAQPWFEIMEWASFLGKGLSLFCFSLLVFIVGFLTRKVREQEVGRYGIYALALSGSLAQIIKHLIGRPRPRLVNMGVFHIGPSFNAGYDSFPSGHAVSSFALAFILARFYPGGKVFFYGFAFLVAFSRLYVGAHFTSDVFSGAWLGFISGFAVFHWRGYIEAQEIRIRQYLKGRVGLRKSS